MKFIISEPKNSGKSRIMKILGFLVEKNETVYYSGDGWSNGERNDQ